jgi:hypothetical protein
MAAGKPCPTSLRTRRWAAIGSLAALELIEVEFYGSTLVETRDFRVR